MVGFLKIRSENFHGPQFQLELYTPEGLKKEYNPAQRNLFQGIFQGVLWIMIIYNLFFFFINRDKTYVYYAAYMFTLSLFFANMFGYLRTYLFPELPILYIYVWLMAQSSAIFYIQFVRYFLNLKDLLPKWDRVSRFLMTGMIAFVVFKATYYLTIHQYGILGSLSQILIFLGVLFTAGLVIALYQTKNKLARYFILGSMSLGVSMLVSSIISISQDGFSLNYFYSLQAGIIGEIAFFSLGLSYKMKVMEQERQRAQASLIDQLQENELIQLNANEELENKVKDRTREIESQKQSLEVQNLEILQQRDLLKSQKEEIENSNDELRGLNEEKNHLIGIVAHDLRNPLTSAMSMAELLKSQNGKWDQDETDSLELIHNSLARMNKMIMKILDVRAIESKNLNLRQEPTDLNGFLAPIIDRFQPKAVSKDIKVCFSPCDSAAYVNVDRNYMIQVVENLMSNAIKFSPNGKEVAVQIHSRQKKIILAVVDQGPGLTNQDQQKLFGKFQKLSARPTGGESSTGLGLSIAKKFVEAMGGIIRCESEEGKGSSFIVEFEAVAVSI